MRLLRLEDNGTFSLIEHTSRIVPPYAILSHTWGLDDEEVTYQDIIAGVGRSKAGYRKLDFCGRRAAKDGLQWFWVDTCCIDKSSSAELSEAINSMFHWYHKSTKCYVYLSDVPASGFASDDQSFQRSRWFTRGWTLQELLAPTSAQFFSVEGDLLGDKSSLTQEIAKITDIPVEALQGRPLPQFSIEERIAWARRRETKREEDEAYSLLGIFDIHMPLLYGEGREKAMIRLQKELQESLRDKQRSLFFGSTAETADAVGELHNYRRIPFSGPGILAHERQIADVQGRILNSLRFPQFQDRRHQIHEAHRETYQWILESASTHNQQWDSLLAWLSSSTESRRVYWIHGKPGSGKSTMMRFLDQNIVPSYHMLPWTENRMVLRAQYFLWNAGNKLQKSITGLLRALLMQLLEQQPNLMPQVVHPGKWVAAWTSENHPIDWTNSDLQHTLHEFILSVRGYAKVLLLLDGLDELDGSDDERQELINILVSMASLENVKICLSSRPWNIFRDAFGEFPQLRLEDLTERDIKKYVEAQLYSHPRFQHLLQYDQINAEILCSGITQKASGVFLWVRLVTRELLKGLRDGDGVRALRKRLEEIPSDLYLYFRGLMDSISPHQRQEASALLQIALHKEDDFATGHPFRLIDSSFIDEEHPNSILTGQYRSDDLDFTDLKALGFRLDSSVRRLNSRCMGLLEIYFEADLDDSTPTSELSQDDQGTNIGRSHSFEPPSYPNISQTYGMTIEFLHRSCRDFLFIPEVQDLLHQYTQCPYDARMYLLNSRVRQFIALSRAGTSDKLALGLASYILSSLGRPSYKHTPICATYAAAVQPMLEKVIHDYVYLEHYWYIYSSVSSWNDEQSSFLTLAIDFDLSSYVESHLSPDLVRMKRGRPVLDYILRPRFFGIDDTTKIGNRKPNLKLLKVALHFSANPNEMYGPTSVWALFLCFLADNFNTIMEAGSHFEYTGALEMLIRAGAAVLLPKHWLSRETFYEAYSDDFSFQLDMSLDERFSSRWPAAVPAVELEQDPGLGSGPWYAVSDLLEYFRPHLGSQVDKLKRALSQSSIPIASERTGERLS